jgi:peptide/nickel transport system permease protein
VLRLVTQRLALGLATLLAVSMLIFAGTEILPGDVATAVLGRDATPEAVAALRQSLGLNDPAVVRYGRWLSGVVQGRLGTSLANGRPIADQLSFRLTNTVFLAAVTAAVAVPLAVGLGILAAITEQSALDRAINVMALAAISLPEFFIGYVLILVVAVHLAWLPSLSFASADMNLGERVRAIALPVTTLTLVVLAQMMRLTRAAILAVMSRPYIETAILKGLPKWRIVAQHALPNVVGPIVNIVALNLAYLVVGVVVVEVVFVYPGMGQFMVDAVSHRDVPVVQACGLIFASAYVSLNLLADVVAILSNPRLRHPR